MTQRWTVPFLALALAVTPALAAQSGEAGSELPPPGFGSLNQNQIAVNLREEALEIRFMPLDERVLRLLGPDAYTSLHGLVTGHQAALDSIARRYGTGQPGLALVTFYGRRPGARFDPQNLTVTIRNRLFRPTGMVPLSPSFASQQLDVRQQASAIFLYDEPLPVYESFTIAYSPQASDDWGSRVTLLERERNRVLARARTGTPDTTRQ